MSKSLLPVLTPLGLFVVFLIVMSLPITLDLNVQPVSDAPAGELTDGFQIAQTYRAQLPGFDGVSLFFATYDRKNAGLVRFAAYSMDTGEKIRENVFPASALEDNSYRKFAFPPREIVGEEILFLVEGKGTKPGGGPSVWLAEKDAYKYGAARIGGEFTDGDLRFMTHYRLSRRAYYSALIDRIASERPTYLNKPRLYKVLFLGYILFLLVCSGLFIRMIISCDKED